MRLFSLSELSTHSRCRLQHHLRYRLCLRSKTAAESEALRIGSLQHDVFEDYYRTGTWRKNEDIGDELVEIMSAHYRTWLEETGADEHWEIDAVEEVVEKEVLAGVKIRGKLDLRVTNTHTGRTAIVDHKTAAGSATRMISEADIAQQLPLYAALSNHSIDDGVYNVLVKKKRTKPEEEWCIDRFTMPLSHTRQSGTLVSVTKRSAKILEEEQDLPTNEDIVEIASPGGHCSWCPFRLPCSSLMNEGPANFWNIMGKEYEEYDPNERYEEEDGDQT